MQNKIDIPGTTISLEIIDKIITVTNKIKYDIQMQFKNQDAEPSLDESGDIFEPLYWLDVKAIPKEPTLQKFFEFIENNKQNLFDLCGFKGELE